MIWTFELFSLQGAPKTGACAISVLIIVDSILNGFRFFETPGKAMCKTSDVAIKKVDRLKFKLVC